MTATTSKILQASLPLWTGAAMPIMGIGTWKLYLPNLRAVLEQAISLGCRHIDCAAVYENEKDVGNVLTSVLNEQQRFGVERNHLFIVSKLWNTKHSRDDVFTACEQTLKDLQLNYLDLYIIHWPFSFEADESGSSKVDENGVSVIKPVPISETWAAMEELVRMGKVRAIGVSNFTVKHLKELMLCAQIKPAVNQVEMHPYLPQPALLSYCETHGIRVVAYSPLGSGKQPSLLEDSVVKDVAKKLGISPAQVLLSWGVTRGTAVIPKTSNPNRLQENFNIRFLEADSMFALDQVGHHFRYVDPVQFWKRDCFDEDS